MGNDNFRRLLPIFLILSTAFSFQCAKKQGTLPEVFRDEPLVTTAGQISLKKLFSLDVTEISLFNKEGKFEQFISFDDQGKIYIADEFNRKIFVYSKQGNFEKTIGKPGQGPGEIPAPIFRILVDGDNLKVYFGFYQIKILSLYGEELSQDTLRVENPLKMNIMNGKYYVLRGKVSQDFTKLDFIISIYDQNMSNGRDVLTYQYPPGLGGPHYDFQFSNWMHVSNHGDVYFPESVLDKYSLLHLAEDGKLKKKFGRTYDVMNYSWEAETKFKALYQKDIESGKRIFPAHPPVIRLMFEDERGNVWVVAGETTEDNGNPDFENTVDVFNPKGEWLHSLKTKIVSRFVLYHKGKIYRVRVMDEEPYKQFIDVYKIVYND